MGHPRLLQQLGKFRFDRNEYEKGRILRIDPGYMPKTERERDLG